MLPVSKDRVGPERPATRRQEDGAKAKQRLVAFAVTARCKSQATDGYPILVSGFLLTLLVVPNQTRGLRSHWKRAHGRMSLLEVVDEILERV